MSEDLFYERNDNISGVSVIGPFDFTPSYGSSVSFQSDNLRFDTNDGYFKIIPNGINNLKAKFNLKRFEFYQYCKDYDVRENEKLRM